MSDISSLSQTIQQGIFAGSLIKSTQQDLVRIYEDATVLSRSTPSGYQIGLLFGSRKAADQSSSAVPETLHLLYFYGREKCLRNCRFEFTRFRQFGLNVLIPEYIGYGMSSGVASEAGCYESADVAYRSLTKVLHVPPSQIIVGGSSLGAAVAIDLAARKSVAGLVALSAFTDVVELVTTILPRTSTTTVQLLIQERFDNLSKIGQVRCPIFISHGMQDEFAPFAMGEQLHRAVSGQQSVTFLPIEGCGHDDIFDFSILWTGLRDFVKQLVPKY
ncbi:MAG: alpha/beta hydrolase [Ktedonobacteraceae bacterium]|nr:alpha/beta hydrolase [Ktedonobacteraceae bacterium]